MPVIEKEGKFFWDNDGPFESDSKARKFGAASFIRGHDEAEKLKNAEDVLKDISEDEIRQAWQRLVEDQGKKKITQDSAEILAAVLTAELINRNQAGLPKEDSKVLTENVPTVKSDSSRIETTKSCISCTDSHWSTVSGILNEAARLVRQGTPITSNEVVSRIQLVKEELNAWERYDASTEKLLNSDEFVQGVIRKMVKKGAQLRHSLIESRLGMGGGTLDLLERASTFARQASQEFERELNENGICLIDKPKGDDGAQKLAPVIAEDGVQVLNPKGATKPVSASEEGEKPNPDQPKGPVEGKTMEGTGMNQMTKALVVAKASLGNGMFRYEVAVGPINKEYVTRLGVGKLGELLSSNDTITHQQIEQLLTGNVLTSQLILRAILEKEKVRKNEVDYANVSPTSDRCATCKSFIKVEGPEESAKEPGGCVKVIGSINPKGSCRLFARGWGPARDKSTGQVRVGERDA